MKHFAKILAVAVLAVLPTLMVGCTDKDKFLGQLVTQQAVGRVIEKEQDPVARQAKAQRIADIAKEVKGVVDLGTETTVNLLVDIVNAKIAAAGLQPSDLLLAKALVTALVDVINEKVGHDGSGVLNPDMKLSVRGVLNDVISTAEVYGAT